MSITHDDYRRARYIVEPASELLLDIVRPDKRGRRTLHPRILLTGQYLAIEKYGIATIARTYQVLTRDLPRELQWDLGVLSGPAHAPKQLAEHHLYRLSKRINPALDHSSKRANHLSPDARMRRRERLDALSAAILMRTLIARPPGSRDYALDGTGIDAPERGVRRAQAVVELEDHEEDSHPLPPDAHDESAPTVPTLPGKGNKGPTDAQWGKKSGDNGGRVTYWGYDVEALIRVPRMGRTGTKRDEPSLVERLVVLPASTDIVDPCLQMLDSLLAHRIEIGELIVDRHYSYKAHDRWLAQLRRRGIHQISDLHDNDHGFREWDGMLIAASHPHCPMTPDRLGRIERPGPNAAEGSHQEFNDRIGEREPYAAQFVNRPDDSGRFKVRCPARNGTVGCPLVAGTVAAAATHHLPIITDPPPPEDRPKICTQDTVTLRTETPAQKRAMKLQQPDYWGSPNWERNFARRTRIEEWFGVLKSSSSTGMRVDSHQFRGLPWVTIVLTLAAAATNVRLLRRWHESSGIGDPTHPLLRPDQPFYGFTQLTAHQAQAIDLQCAPRYAAGPGPTPDDSKALEAAS